MPERSPAPGGNPVAGAVNEARLGRIVAELSSRGALPGGGLDRQALTEEDLAGRRYLVDLATSLGAEPFRDPAGNFFFRWAGREDLPPVATGSHADSQPSGGNLDGAFGVCAALEVLSALAEVGYHARRPIEAVIWTNEEGSRFTPGTMGSSAFVDPGLLDGVLVTADRDGVTVREALDRLDAAFPDVTPRRLAEPFDCFVEAHIEQGPILESRSLPIGVVRGIQGCRWFEFRTKGRSGHAGSTPLSHKRDALMAAVEVAAGVYDALRQGDERLRVTIGRLHVFPDSVNVIPAEVMFTVDLRHPETETLDAVEARLRALAQPTAGCDVEIRRTMLMPPTHFEPLVVDAVRGAVERWSIPHMDIDSGPFHDALRLNEHCPTGMIFVPSIEGISHNPDERTNLADLATGARILAEAVVALADREANS
jgi:beta-ureidopropionase / N-carbamoyl-L-amino-acid hydrolase